MRSDTEHLAAGIVRLIVTHLVDGRGTDLLPGAPDLQELAKVFLRLRPLAEHVVQVELARGLKLSANEMLGERVGGCCASWKSLPDSSSDLPRRRLDLFPQPGAGRFALGVAAPDLHIVEARDRQRRLAERQFLG